MNTSKKRPGESALDDEDFNHAEAHQLDRSGLVELRLGLQACLNDLRTRFDAARRRGYKHGSFMPVDEFTSLEAAVRRKGLQMQWVQSRITRLHAEEAARRDPAAKAAAKESFHARFFELCRKELNPGDFRELCKMAEVEPGGES